MSLAFPCHRVCRRPGCLAQPGNWRPSREAAQLPLSSAAACVGNDAAGGPRSMHFRTAAVRLCYDTDGNVAHHILGMNGRGASREPPATGIQSGGEAQLKRALLLRICTAPAGRARARTRQDRTRQDKTGRARSAARARKRRSLTASGMRVARERSLPCGRQRAASSLDLASQAATVRPRGSDGSPTGAKGKADAPSVVQSPFTLPSRIAARLCCRRQAPLSPGSNAPRPLVPTARAPNWHRHRSTLCAS